MNYKFPESLKGRDGKTRYDDKSGKHGKADFHSRSLWRFLHFPGGVSSRTEELTHCLVLNCVHHKVVDGAGVC